MDTHSLVIIGEHDFVCWCKSLCQWLWSMQYIVDDQRVVRLYMKCSLALKSAHFNFFLCIMKLLLFHSNSRQKHKKKKRFSIVSPNVISLFRNPENVHNPNPNLRVYGKFRGFEERRNNKGTIHNTIQKQNPMWREVNRKHVWFEHWAFFNRFLSYLATWHRIWSWWSLSDWKSEIHWGSKQWHQWLTV